MPNLLPQGLLALLTARFGSGALGVLMVLGVLSATVSAQPMASGVVAWPPSVRSALERAQVPPEALAVVVQEVGGGEPRLIWQASQPMNPASLMKLLTTYSALDTLGPAWVWSTPVWLQGQVSAQGVLNGDLVIKGTGDPKLVMERVWLLLRRVQQLGVREIRGDIVLDRSAFVGVEDNPGEFDGETLRPYNVRPDALMLNYKTLVLQLLPDERRGVATVALDPPLAEVLVDAQVPLSAGACDDWRTGLKAELSNPARIRLQGRFPLSCGEKSWPLAFAEPRTYNERLLKGMWQALGGRLSGRVRDGVAPITPPSFEVQSPALAETVRDINKFSNNVMAQQLFLTLGLTQMGQGSPEAARSFLRGWMERRLGVQTLASAEPLASELVVDNGSGLSRDNRVSAKVLAAVLQSAWASPVMPELMSSLPVSGTDGTLKRSTAPAGRAHLKTGSLRDVAGVAGYVLSSSGRRFVLVALINHPKASAARPALDAWVQWAAGL
jgi:D-alanyl-D-alanine carboxypeptidase/D-alanyl-D-alanine-endopeptidase (penicillin-binding protein 4)